MKKAIDVAAAGESFLQTWSAVFRQWGDTDKPPRLDGVRQDNCHGDPTQAEALRALGNYELDMASRVAGYINEYKRGFAADRRMADVLKEKYVGRKVDRVVGQSVHGIIIRKTWDGPCEVHTVAARMNLPPAQVQWAIRKGRRKIGADILASEAVSRGTVGDVQRA